MIVLPPAHAAPLTMDQAVEQALARAPELKAAEAGIEGARKRVDQAWSANLPRFSLEASYLAKYPKMELPIELPPIPGMEPIGEIDDIHHFQASGSVQYRLLDLSRGPRVDAARQALAGERAQVDELSARLAFQVRATFLAGLFTQEVRKIAAESLRVAQAEEKRAQLRVEVGTGSQLALAQARVRVAQLKAQYRQADSDLAQHLEVLGSLLGRPAPSALEGDLPALAQIQTDRALERAPALARLRSGQVAAELSAKSLDRGFIPTLSLMAKAGVEYPSAMQLQWGPMLQGGVSLIWDLFDGGLRKHRSAEALSKARRLTHLHLATTQQLRRKLIKLEARQRAAQASFNSYQETLKQNQIYLRVARAAVETGTGTQLDIFNAELGIDRAKIAVQKALFEKALACAEALMVHGVTRPSPRTSGGAE